MKFFAVRCYLFFSSISSLGFDFFLFPMSVPLAHLKFLTETERGTSPVAACCLKRADVK